MGRIRTYEGLACLVTGASSGIGREMAYELARRKARVVVSARRAERLDEVVAECLRLGAPAAWKVVADLALTSEVERLAREAVELAGPIDVLVNNAGFAVPGLFPRSDLERTLEMVRVNVEAPVILARRLLPGMLQRDLGGILNVASVAGFSGSPLQSTYAGTKGFLRLWSHSVHAEVKHTQVAISALCPGVTDTEFFEAAGFTKLTGFMTWRASAAKVARKGLDALARGTMQVIPGGANKTLMFARRLTSERFAVLTARRLMMGRAKALRSRPGQEMGRGGEEA